MNCSRKNAVILKEETLAQFSDELGYIETSLTKSDRTRGNPFLTTPGRIVPILLIMIFFFASLTNSLAAGPEGDIDVVSTYESAGITFSPTGFSYQAGDQVKVLYRIKDSNANYSKTENLWFDSRDTAAQGGRAPEYRGSILHLKPATLYQLKLALYRNDVEQQQWYKHFSTWSDNYPIGIIKATNSLIGSDLNLVVEKDINGDIIGEDNFSGTEAGYTIYDGTGLTIDGQETRNSNIILKNVHHIIIRGYILKNAVQSNILLMGDTNNIIFEDLDISKWGEEIEPNSGFGKRQAAIHASSGTIKRITIQRNYIHHPRYDSNSWEETNPSNNDNHPYGPMAISFLSNSSGGNHVIRYNTVRSDPDHQFEDIISGGSNFSNEGFPAANSDIYSNDLSYAWDDAIESDGRNLNVRIWGNFITKTLVGISGAPTCIGPLYIFRNIYAESYVSDKNPDGTPIAILSDRKNGGFVKGETHIDGSLNPYCGGLTYIYHNTVLQEPIAGTSKTKGSRIGLGYGSEMFNVIAKNNILQIGDPSSSIEHSISDQITRDIFSATLMNENNIYQSNLYNGKFNGITMGTPGSPYSDVVTGFQGINGIPVYLANTDTDPATTPWRLSTNASNSSLAYGYFELDSSSLGYNAGVTIQNINDSSDPNNLGFSDGIADIGAQENGVERMEFGVHAYTNKKSHLPMKVQDAGTDYLAFQAEDGFLYDESSLKWEVVTDSSASAGKAVRATNKSMTATDPHAEIQFNVQFANSTRYYSYALVRNDSGNPSGSDSIYVQEIKLTLDAITARHFTLAGYDPANSGTYQWIKMDTFWAQKGLIYIFKIGAREKDGHIDAIVFHTSDNLHTDNSYTLDDIVGNL
ncbi:MAG: hypothetical protein L3J71_07780 [Victivallaceae bacterium]|nr:hypothetical protein [Victivallaceae bacterium]